MSSSRAANLLLRYFIAGLHCRHFGLGFMTPFLPRDFQHFFHCSLEMRPVERLQGLSTFYWAPLFLSPTSNRFGRADAALRAAIRASTCLDAYFHCHGTAVPAAAQPDAGRGSDDFVGSRDALFILPADDIAAGPFLLSSTAASARRFATNELRRRRRRDGQVLVSACYYFRPAAADECGGLIFLRGFEPREMAAMRERMITMPWPSERATGPSLLRCHLVYLRRDAARSGEVGASFKP